MPDAKLYTIGYSAFHQFDAKPDAEKTRAVNAQSWTIDGFVAILKSRNIDALIDVRSKPYSRMFPEYNKEFLCGYLQRFEVGYRHYKDGLGAQQENEEWLSEDESGEEYLDFEKYAVSKAFIEAVGKIENGIELGHTPVLMCAENDPKMCHRTILVSRRFYEDGFEVEHIILEGKQEVVFETQEDIETELKKLFKKKNSTGYIFPDDTQQLFDTGDRRLSHNDWREASYRMQNLHIGYRPTHKKEGESQH